MIKPNPVGRPTVMSTETIDKLEEAFMYGANDKEACFISGISRTTFYDYCKENPEFIDRIEDLKNMTKYIAKKNIARAVEKEQDLGGVTLSQWYSERKAKEDGYAVRTEVTGANGDPVNLGVIMLPPKETKNDSGN